MVHQGLGKLHWVNLLLKLWEENSIVFLWEALGMKMKSEDTEGLTLVLCRE